MNHPYDEETWAALLEADPTLREVWDTFQAKLYERARKVMAGDDSKADGLREACDAVYAAVGEGQSKH